MPHWLMKSEPDAFSVTTLQRLRQARWDGVRNYQARNFLRSMQPDELFFFYHSSCPRPGIAGIGRVVTSAYPDPSALEPHSPYFNARASAERNPWVAVDVEFVEAFTEIIELARLRSTPELAQLPLLQKGSRLSVMPVSAGEWSAILALR
ncbi:EVE domain-containing protein [Azotobacter salinestris]|uniref:EVE domain-containing protein n=1 Tax=Azotobacter salinestris TaxID=69964 RepID=UPI0032E03212